MHSDITSTGLSGCPTGILLCIINYVDDCTETCVSCAQIIAVVLAFRKQDMPPVILTEKVTKSKKNKN
jgi:hypothetical protein